MSQKNVKADDVAVIGRNLALESVRVTEAAALAASRFMGRGDERAADLAAMEAMRTALDSLLIDGTVVIGEGDPGEAAVLCAGEKVGQGKGHASVDIALNPLEGATICAKGGYNALAVMALAVQGGFLRVPSVYMDKIAVGPDLPEGVVNLDAPVERNLRELAKAKSVDVSDLLICILDRPRHEALIEKVREAGARVMLIADGDVSGVIAAGLPHTGVDMHIGVGGAPEGVLAAAALGAVGGQMQARLVLRSDDERAMAAQRGIKDFSHIYSLNELARGDVMFAATGVTDGAILRGVRRYPGGAMTHSMVIRARSGTLRFIETRHNWRRKTGFA